MIRWIWSRRDSTWEKAGPDSDAFASSILLPSVVLIPDAFLRRYQGHDHNTRFRGTNVIISQALAVELVFQSSLIRHPRPRVQHHSIRPIPQSLSPESVHVQISLLRARS